ncbi:SLC13 family permease [Tenggerimyces flavus]|uniref:SLC13 family permease n=1 Tax=Tenggerimyces flavus TaxID=1708749 RepID=A0ABV7Y9X3_9ACTN|nr:SLC13 family permease [Tenggerimyces flavus]MBM7785384.1 Na+/H+ antiporter NhaD/arsenite permease-like protein [Tenggerimyces flavus]
MSAEHISILVLVAMFVIATVLPVNLGALALVGAFLVGTLAANMDTGTILDAFPGKLFVTLVGITYLFAIATNNGTVDWVVRVSIRLVRGRLVAIPFVMFILATLLTAVGAPAPAVAAILAPIAFGFAKQYDINALLIGLMVAHGTQAGAFSPISVLGGIVNEVVSDAKLPSNDVVLFLSSFAFNTAAAVVVFCLFGGLPLFRRVATAEDEETEKEKSSLRLTWHQALTVTGILVLCVLALFFDLDVGLVAVTVAVVLSLASPKANRGAVDRIAWSTVLLIGGVVTYVGVLQEIGTIDYIGTSVAAIGAPLLAALLICYVGGVVSAFASSVGILGALIPLAVPFLLQGELGAVGLIAALSVSSTIVDVSPFSTTGALLVANVQGMDRQVFYKRLLAYGAVIVAVGPLLTWLVLVAPGWL